MRKLIFLLIAALALACSKDNNPGPPSSVNGYWMVSTPDGFTTVTFKIGVGTNNEPVIESVLVNHQGTTYTQSIDVSLIPLSGGGIESISFRATEFVILLEGITVNADFTEMQIAHSTFTFGMDIRNFAVLKGIRR
jgi:hypothetical protein